MDRLIFGIIALIERYHSLVGLERKRNRTEHSLTLVSKRPDFMGIAQLALLLKSEEKTDEKEMRTAVKELTEKMANWSEVYHGKVEHPGFHSLHSCPLVCVDVSMSAS